MVKWAGWGDTLNGNPMNWEGDAKNRKHGKGGKSRQVMVAECRKTHTQCDTHTHTHIYIYIYMYIYMRNVIEGKHCSALWAFVCCSSDLLIATVGQTDGRTDGQTDGVRRTDGRMVTVMWARPGYAERPGRGAAA